MKMYQPSLARIIACQSREVLNLIIITYSTNHYTIVDTLEQSDGLVENKLMFKQGEDIPLPELVLWKNGRN